LNLSPFVVRPAPFRLEKLAAGVGDALLYDSLMRNADEANCNFITLRCNRV
jgi:hypothetical protein